MSRNHSDDIAVIGISTRFPGEHSDLASWWNDILQGKTFITRYTKDELIKAGVQNLLIDDPEYIPVRGHLDNITHFDNVLFQINNRDAEMLDPQHRFMLETSWNALEDAGYGKYSTRPNKIGVFASSSGSGYMRTILTQGPLEPDILEQVIHGMEPDFIASLISYKLNLTGPAMSVQTACSSSLVALHLARQSLLSGDSDMALVVAAGIAFPQGGYLHVPGGINSASGVCRPFDHRADGVLEGSGAACIVLKRVRDLSEQDTEIYGVIANTAINNDGAAKAGYFAPSIEGQIAVIKQAIGNANIDATTIGYLETHGTGTYIGDPIEWTSTSEAYRQLGALPKQIAIGALKANTGHLDAAAGLAALIKAMLVIKTGKIPPVANFEKLNPYMDCENTPLYIPNIDGFEWKVEGIKRAAISAFGIGGTNAHVIIEDPALVATVERKPEQHTPYIFALSAGNQKTLKRYITSMCSELETQTTPLEDIAYTLCNGREELSERVVACALTKEEIINQLIQYQHSHSYTASSAKKTNNVVFAFPGQGTQFPGMGIAYAETLPNFKQYVTQCIGSLKFRKLQTLLEDALFDRSFMIELLNQTEIAQPALFIVEYAVAKSLVDLGIKPVAFIGHSLGEITAMCIAGVLSLNDALHFVCIRGQAMQACPEGQMLSMNCTEEEAIDLIKQTKLQVSIAAINAEESCVIAGCNREIPKFKQMAEAQKFRCKVLKSTRAFHTGALQAALTPMHQELDAMTLYPTQLLGALNLDGTLLEVGAAPSTEYFIQQAVNPVKFFEAFQALENRLDNILIIEVGPGQVLSALIDSCESNAVALLPAEQSTAIDIMTNIANLWEEGVGVDLSTLNPQVGKLTHFPTYPFDGPEWIAPEVTKAIEYYKDNNTRKGVTSTLSNKRSITLNKQQPPNFSDKQIITSELSQLWTELLRIDNIHATSNFFNLGGDSLSITSLIRKINKNFNIKISPREVMGAQTLEDQVEIIYTTIRNESSAIISDTMR